jgi:hypothetical protein
MWHGTRPLRSKRVAGARPARSAGLPRGPQDETRVGAQPLHHRRSPP